MAEIATNLAAALQASLTSELLKTLSQTTGSVSSLPESIQLPTRALVLSGTVVSQSPGNNPGEVTVQTTAGQVTIALDNPASSLPKGAVSLLIQPGSPPTATIVGQVAPSPAQAAETPPPAPTIESNAAQASIQQTTLLQTSPLPVLAAGQIVTATVLPPLNQGLAPPVTATLPVLASGAVSSQGASSAASAPPLPTGTLLTNAVAPASTTPPGPGFVPTAAQQAAALPALAQPQANTPETQSFLILKVIAPDQASDEPEAPAPLPLQTQASQAAAGPPITATVVAQSQTSQPLLATPAAALLLTKPTQVETGSAITLQRVASPDAASASSAAPRTAAAAPLTLQPLAIASRPVWPALTQLLGVLQPLAGDVGTSLASSLPKTGAGFVESLVAFLTPSRRNFDGAVTDRMRDVSSEASAGTPQAEMAKQIRGLLAQIQSDLGVGAKPPGGAATGTWHAYPVPLMNGPTLEMLQMFVRRQIDPHEEGADPKHGSVTTRFLVEVSPSQMGPVQLDGLLRTPRNQPQRLDLIVRTAAPLPEAACTEMDALFKTALVAGNLAGGLRFQQGRNSFVLPRSDGGGHVTRTV